MTHNAGEILHSRLTAEGEEVGLGMCLIYQIPREVKVLKMVDLSTERITPSAVFANVETDLCGPFQTNASNSRTEKTMKVYTGCPVYDGISFNGE